MIPFLKDESLNRQFHRDGFIKLRKPDRQIVEALCKIYDAFRDYHSGEDMANRFHATQDAKNPELAKNIDEQIKQTLAGWVEKNFTGYKMVLGAFLIKEPGEGSVHALHQDWNFTDESVWFSSNLWIPLSLTNRQNGCLRFLPGSQHITPTIRSNYMFEWAFREVEKECNDYLVDVPTKEEECILLNHATVHSSWPNLSEQPRVVTILTLVPENAELLHYYSEDGRNIEEYQIDIPDIYTMSLGKRPEAAKLVRKFMYDTAPVTPELFARWIHSRIPDYPVLKNFFQDRFLLQNGYCLINLFSQQIISALRHLFEETVAGQKLTGFYANHNRGDVQESIHVSQQILALTRDVLEKTFPDFTYYVGHFVVKSPETDYTFSLHQDWNIVEEFEEKSFQIWIPLSSVDRLNGGLFVLPGSHTYFRNYRSGSFGIPLVKGNNSLSRYTKDLTVPEGSAVIFQNNLFHGSHPNQTKESRISVLINIIEKKAKPFLAHKANHKTSFYRMTGVDLLHHLHTLEKGIVPDSMPLIKDGGLPPVKNESIDANRLTEKFLSRQFTFPQGAYRIIQNDDTFRELEDKGYTVLPFLHANEITAIQHLYAQKGIQTLTKSRYTSLEEESEEERMQTKNALLEIVNEKMSSLFLDYKTPIIQFFVKGKKSSGDVDFHSDVSLVLNQSIEPNYGLWIPLVDVNESNGAMIVVPNSHTWYNGVIAGPWPFYPFMEKLKKKSICVPMRAGQILIFDTRLIHSSSFNNTDTDRLSIVARIVHQTSSLYSFAENKKTGKIDVFREKDDFYYRKNNKTEGAGSYEREWTGELNPQPLAEHIVQMLYE